MTLELNLILNEVHPVALRPLTADPSEPAPTVLSPLLTHCCPSQYVLPPRAPADSLLASFPSTMCKAHLAPNSRWGHPP